MLVASTLLTICSLFYRREIRGFLCQLFTLHQCTYLIGKCDRIIKQVVEGVGVVKNLWRYFSFCAPVFDCIRSNEFIWSFKTTYDVSVNILHN